MRYPRHSRRGSATVEFAIMLPWLGLLFVIVVDLPRAFYYSVILSNCARQGAMYASDPFAASRSPYADLTAAALADASNINPKPTVTKTTGTDSAGFAYVEVTVQWQFSTVTQYLGTSGPMTLTRKVRMRVAPTTPG